MLVKNMPITHCGSRTYRQNLRDLMTLKKRLGGVVSLKKFPVVKLKARSGSVDILTTAQQRSLGLKGRAFRRAASGAIRPALATEGIRFASWEGEVPLG